MSSQGLHFTWLCPSTAGCSPPSASPIVCLMPSCSRWYASSLLCHHRDFTSLHYTSLGFVHPLQAVALHQCLPFVVCLMLSCSRWFPPSLLCHPATFCLVILLIFSLIGAAALCNAWSVCCLSFSLDVQPIPICVFRMYSTTWGIFVIYLFTFYLWACYLVL